MKDYLKDYLVVFRNNKIADMKLVARNPQEAKSNALVLAQIVHKNTHVMVKSIWLCTRL
ncbi:hypothetical protein LCGC14_1136850 [marine sediment metagenome]|uniref:Uncharacterized protein n=1 Tax=marine sediment metagenome TaxID=412755 RepID=A0A0F9MME3_9ZZZZ